MGFFKDDEKKDLAYKSIDSLTLYNIAALLEGYSQTLLFNGAGKSERVERNHRYVAQWSNMDADTFRKRCESARTLKKTIYQTSGAITETGAVRMPVDDSGEYIRPILMDIIKLQEARLDRIDFAKQKEAEDLATGWEPND